MSNQPAGAALQFGLLHHATLIEQTARGLRECLSNGIEAAGAAQRQTLELAGPLDINSQRALRNGKAKLNLHDGPQQQAQQVAAQMEQLVQASINRLILLGKSLESLLSRAGQPPDDEAPTLETD